MTLSPALLDFFLERTGQEVTGDTPVGGGCINDTIQVSLQDGSRYFVKQNKISLRDMFEKEATGLQLLADATGETGEIRIPEVTGLTEDHESGQAFLILSFVDEGRRSGDFDRRFGSALAVLHRHTTRQYGLDHDNYIGSLPQKNDRRETWNSFFMECRLEPQFAMAREQGFFNGTARQSLERLGKNLPELLPEEPPSLLHGDLWGGNYLCDNENRPVLIDPAVYYGHREAELAFTTLFGGFGREFYSGYEESWPLQPGFAERRDIYNLYPLLVHVNLFGGMYVSQTESILRRY
ncbi:MAG: ketosamine-3-kinase [Balneolaceae bacterium]|nr:MAG: ketosamine-3-kinase [Balneolaceae bacterium]